MNNAEQPNEFQEAVAPTRRSRLSRMVCSATVDLATAFSPDSVDLTYVKSSAAASERAFSLHQDSVIDMMYEYSNSSISCKRVSSGK